jgi:hypothetical protein
MKYVLPVMMLCFFIPGQAHAQTNCTTVSYVLVSDVKNSIPPSATAYYETMTYNVSCVNSSTGTTSTPNEGSSNSQLGIGVVLTKPNCSSNCTVRCDPLWSISIIKIGFTPVVFINVADEANGAVTDGVCHYDPPPFLSANSSTCPAQACASGGGGSGGTGCTGSDGEPLPECKVKLPSPVILDLNGKGFDLTSAQGGVLFDISGTGNPVQIAWTASGADNAFLALPGLDGLVHNGQQLFGNFTPQPASDHPNGFAALAVYDLPENGGNGDGVIDSRDAVFASLRLWIDANHDGICQPEELYTLPSLGVNSISLKYALSEKEDKYGNDFRYRALVNPDDPDASRVDRKAYDVFFVTLGEPTSQLMPRKPVPMQGQKCALPAERKRGMLCGGGL